MFENSKVLKTVRLNYLKTLLNQNKYHKMIESMNVNNKDELDFVLECISKLNDTQLLYLYACRTDYQKDYVNDLFYKLEYTNINPEIKSSDKEEIVEKSAAEIVQYALETKNPDVNRLKELIKLSNNKKYIYLYWLYIYTNSEDQFDLVDLILKSNDIDYIYVLYSQFSNSETNYALNTIAPTLFKDNMIKDFEDNIKYKKLIEKINYDMYVKFQLMMIKLNLDYDNYDIDLNEEIKKQNRMLEVVIREYNKKRINKRDILHLIDSKNLPLIGTLKFICNSQEQIDALIDKVSDDEYIDIIKENYSRHSDYTYTDALVDIVYNQALLMKKEAQKVK